MTRAEACSFRLECDRGFRSILGIDEAGRGCLAGPVFVAGVIFPEDLRSSREKWMSRINDSKSIRPAEREELETYIKKYARAYEVVSVEPDEIDQINILRATLKGMRLVAENISSRIPVDLVFVDGPIPIPQIKMQQEALVKGDQRSKTIAAASILAKVARDRWMTSAHDRYPQFDFKQNKGYGTSSHWQALDAHGPTPLHRQSFLKKWSLRKDGRESEELVENFLKERGFSICDRNWRKRSAEIDLIAEKDGVLHFFEVRSRSKASALERVFPGEKQGRCRKAVDLYMTFHPLRAPLARRFHLVTVMENKIQPHWDVLGW